MTLEETLKELRKVPRQIIIEIQVGGEIVLRKDETISIPERTITLQAVLQTPNIPIIPLAEVKDPPENLANQTNEKENGKSRPTTGGNSNRNKGSKNSKQ